VIKGLNQVLANLNKQRHVIPDKAITVLTQGGKDIQELAKKYAPLDLGPLESSIKVRESITEHQAIVSIYVDPNTPTPIAGKVVGDYALTMHEGEYNLGPRSLSKQAASGLTVGPKYLSRSLNDNKPRILAELREVIRKHLKR
jgi:succinate dehydrogenase/fumarate reductase flavoprotein subunit